MFIFNGETRSEEESGQNSTGCTKEPGDDESPGLASIPQVETGSAGNDSAGAISERKEALENSVDDQEYEDRAEEPRDKSWNNLRLGLERMNESQKNFNVEKRILRGNRAGTVTPRQTRRRRTRSKDANRESRTSSATDEDGGAHADRRTDHNVLDLRARRSGQDYPQPLSEALPLVNSSETEETKAAGFNLAEKYAASSPKRDQTTRKTSKWAIVKGGLAFISKMKQEVEKKREENADTMDETPVDIVSATQKHAEVFKKRSPDHT